MGGVEQNQLRQYLLGKLTDAEEEQIELRLLTESDFVEEYDIVVDEITDDYVLGKFAGEELGLVEQNFFKSEVRREKLKFALALEKRKAERRKKENQRWLKPLSAIAACLLVAVSGVYLWRVSSRNAEVNDGLAALQAAYRNERPFQSRISGFDHAPFISTRGAGETGNIDQESLQLAEFGLLKAKNRNPNAATRYALGKVYLAKKEFDSAIEQFDEALKGDPDNAQMYSDLGTAWLEKGKIDQAGKDPGKGIEELGRSLEHLNKALELNPNLLEALFNRALDYQYMMAFSEAEASWKDYINRDPNSLWADEAKRNLQQLEGRQKTSWDTTDALRSFLAARDRRDDDAAWKAITEYYTSGGNEVTNALLDAVLEPAAQTGIQDPSGALSYLAKLELARAGDSYTSDLVNELERQLPQQRKVSIDARRTMRGAYALFRTSQYKDAVVSYSEAKRQYEKLGDLTEQIFVEYRLAHCYLFLKDLKQAELIFKRLSAVCLVRGYPWLTAQCLYGLSHASYDNSQYTKAIDYSRRALTGFERAGDLNGILKSLTQLAQANQTLNRIDRAFKYLSRALTLGSETPVDPLAKWGMLLQIAFDMSSQDLHQAALVYQKEALEVALKMGRPLITSRSYDNLGSKYAAVKRYTDGIEAANRAMKIGEAMPNNSGGKEIIAHAAQQLGDIRRQAGKCDQAISDYDKSIDIYKELKIEYYSYVAHKGKLICFIASNNDQASSDELPRVLALCGEYRSKITDQSQRVSFFANQQSVYDLAIVYASARLHDSNKAFNYSEESRARAFLDEIRQGAQVLEKNEEPEVNLPTVTRSMSLAEIQKNIPVGSQILQYAVLDNRLLMWVVTQSEFHEVSVESEQLNQKVHAFLDHVNRAGGDPGEAAKSAEDLYSILIAPVESFLDKSKYLCIVPDKILNYVPYQALVSPATTRFLIEDYDLGTAPSTTTFIDLTGSAQKKAGSFDEQLLSVGNPHFNQTDFDSLVALPSAATEAETVATLYQNPKSRVLLNDEATETEVRSQIEKSDVAHFAMHYIVNDQIETLSGFPLTPDKESIENETSNGFLQSYEIYGLRLPRTRLVVLSGCQTGIEQHYAGEGAIGAARPFIIAGVPTVVATLWPVDSEASAELMANFHRHRIRDPLPVAQALRRAQIEMARSNDPRYRHPYYWAAFNTIGGFSSY